jgi:hypothetical protein
MRSKDLLHSGGRGAIALALGATLLLSLAAPVAACHPGRPFFGHTYGSSILAPATAACPPGSIWFVTAEGTGNFTHLGRVNFALEQCATANVESGWGHTVGKASMTIVAANGDLLELSYDMTFHANLTQTPATAKAWLDWEVAGGTGRFVDATGSGEAIGHVQYTPDLTGATISLYWWGTIRY